MNLTRSCTTMGCGSLLAVAACALGAGTDEVRWLVEYRADTLPTAPLWTRRGGDAAKVEIADGALHLTDNSEQDFCCYRATWDGDPDAEIVVEAKIRVTFLAGYKHGGKGKGISALYAPWVTGSPVGLLVSNGRFQEGLLLCERYIANFMDRFYPMDTTDRAHVYRLVIRGHDMSVYVDDELRIAGRDAFWKPATDPKPFIQFGSNSPGSTGESSWEYVRLGVRPAHAEAARTGLKITLSEPWFIPQVSSVRETRPYLYDVGEGVLLLSVAQGPDKHFEPYGVLKSTDEGRTWQAVPGLQEKTWAPQPMIRLQPGGSILGASRWSLQYQDYAGKTHYVGISYLFDPRAETFTMQESKTILPPEADAVVVFDRHIFDLGGGVVRAVVYDARSNCYLVESSDQGATWTHVSTLGRGDEPGVARLSETDWTAVLRKGSAVPLQQVWSQDGGKTWSAPTTLEAGSVDPDIVLMSNGVLACSYGRPGCNIMFSTDRGKTWDYHRVITDSSGYNYTTIREVRPGRLLYIHDAPPLTALYIDVTPVQ
jgi:hypothetical protein